MARETLRSLCVSPVHVPLATITAALPQTVAAKHIGNVTAEDAEEGFVYGVDLRSLFLPYSEETNSAVRYLGVVCSACVQRRAAANSTRPRTVPPRSCAT